MGRTQGSGPRTSMHSDYPAEHSDDEVEFRADTSIRSCCEDGKNVCCAHMFFQL